MNAQKIRKGIQKIFAEVVTTYELVNHLLTFGLDISWRKKAAREAIKAKGFLWLDVCTGTGEMALNLHRFSKEKVKIITVDFCQPMLEMISKKKDIPNLTSVLAEASFLPFFGKTFDLVTISFATRNIYLNRDVLNAHLKEFYRVLRPGGHFVNLETSQPSLKIIQKFFHTYIKIAVKPLGYLVSGSKTGYSYLASTIPRFFSPEEFSTILRKAGFTTVMHHSLFLGVAAIHKAIRPVVSNL